MADAEFDYDLFVIGGGSGGVRAARIAAQYGASVAIAEEYRFGGTCVIRGCVPKKLMVYASAYSEHFEDARAYGWDFDATPSFNWETFRERKDMEIARLEGVYRKNLHASGVEIHECRATVAGPHTVRLADHGREISAKHILIAVGGRPFVPEFPGSQHAITSNEIFHLPELPKRLLIAGGGYIASEFAGIMNGLGVEVTQIYRKEQILRGFDDEVRTHVQQEMAKKGVNFIFNETLDSLEKTPSGLIAHVANGEKIEIDQAMFATGRRPNTDGLGLENAGLELGRGGEVPVSAYSQTKVPSIYAVGDVTDRLQLTPVAIREGHAFADTVFGGLDVKPDHELVPTAVFTQPEIGTVGMNEAAARERGPVEIYRTNFRAMLHAFADRDERMLMKLIVDKESRRVLGAHVVGHAAGEMAQLIGIAVKMGATKEDFDRTVAVHPTASEEFVTMRTPVGG
ncbi:MAG: glutathione-disulfide reductase [Pseudomonadota bacterium]